MAAEPATADAAATKPRTPYTLLMAMLDEAELPLVPQTGKSSASGNAPSGVAILKGDTLAPSANAEHKNPPLLLHGMSNCIRKFYELIPGDQRPGNGKPAGCNFFVTREPCPRCMSAFAWAGRTTAWYLLSYDDTEEMLGNEWGIDIFKNVYQAVRPGLFSPDNKFFAVRSVDDIVQKIEDPVEMRTVMLRIDGMREVPKDDSRKGKRADDNGIAVRNMRIRTM